MPPEVEAAVIPRAYGSGAGLPGSRAPCFHPGMDAGTQVVLLVLLVGVAMLLVSSLIGSAQRRQTRTEARLAELQRTVDALAEHLGVTVPEPQHPEVERLLAAGQQVAAVKAYRQATGADLLTARNAVEELARRR